MNEADELYDIPQGATRLKVKESWFYQNIHSKTLPMPYLKVGRYVRIKRSDLDAYIQRITVPAGGK